MKNKKHWSEDFDKVCIPFFFGFSIISISLHMGLFIPHMVAEGEHILVICLVALLGSICCLMASLALSGIFASMVCNVGNFFYKNKLRKDKKKENKSIEFENWIRSCRLRDKK